ncbi:hypothetical protein BGZ97_006272, partial [Linnemannia gamsii]
LGKWAVYLVWGSGAAGLVADDALIVNAVGLSMVTRQFLKQRGALDESSFAMADSDGDEELLLPEDISQSLRLLRSLRTLQIRRARRIGIRRISRYLMHQL